MLALQNYAGSSSGSSSGAASSDNDSDADTRAAGTSGKTKPSVDPEALAHLKPISVPEASVSRAICVQAAPDVVPIVRAREAN